MDTTRESQDKTVPGEVLDGAVSTSDVTTGETAGDITIGLQREDLLSGNNRALLTKIIK